MAQASTMTLRRAALYIGGASLLVAWFSSAASLSLNRSGAQAVPAEPAPAAATDNLAVELRAQRRLLRERLASAPVPQQPLRNPFAFRARAAKPAAVPRTGVPTVPAAPMEPPEPVLTLIGVAERLRETGAERTAMIATEGDQLILAGVGDVVLQRYRVIAISAEVAELSDLTTGRVRRIALQ
jgi:hypothetical protein